MKLVSFQLPTHSATRAGLLIENNIHLFDDHITTLSLIAGEEKLVVTPDIISLDRVTLAPPVQPSKIIAIGRNYLEHAHEMKQDLPSHPLIFGIFPSALIGSGGVIRWKRAITNEVDWEGELAVIIGKPAHRVAEADALDYVFGYTIANDVTARDLQHRIDKQWTRGKSLDTFCPLGPAITFARDVEDVQNLDVTTTVNGEIMQHGSTADMIFSVAYLVSYCSQMFTLYPGDIILTGTPSGVGAGRKPPVFLKDGDVVAISMTGLGTLTNPCQSEE